MRTKKRSKILPHDVHDEKSATEVNFVKDNSLAVSLKRKAKRKARRKAKNTREQTESHGLLEAAHTDDITSHNGENNKENTKCLHNSKSDALKTIEEASSPVSSSTLRTKEKSLSLSKHVTEGTNEAAKNETVVQIKQSETIALSKTIIQTSRKLLVLDLNGILADILYIPNADQIKQEHITVSYKKAFKRPFCDDFLNFCFSTFDVGVWSSRMKHNVEVLVDYLMGNMKQKLLFCWDSAKCTQTGFDTIGQRGKPLVLKELRKLWNKEGRNLPWKRGTYSASNTLLIDDSACKAICNPPYTGIFPQPYSFQDENDDSLGPGGDIRVFLEGLAKADSVQEYVKRNPFGQPAITADHPSWKFYLQVTERVQKMPKPTKRGKKRKRPSV